MIAIIVLFVFMIAKLHGFNRIALLSTGKIRKHFLSHGNRQHCSTLASTNDDVNPKGKGNGEFISVALKKQNEEWIKQLEMEERMREARGWESKQLSDKEAETLNRLLGIEDELMNQEKPSRKMPKREFKERPQAMSFRSSDADDAKIRGFLELNPNICSGCGTPFQTKSEEKPGFLSSDKYQEHRKNAEKIRSYQDALKILYDASIELDSPMAETLLRDANLSEDIIAGIKLFSDNYESRNPVNIKTDADIAKPKKSNQYRGKDDLLGALTANSDIDIINDINDEANPEQKRRIVLPKWPKMPASVEDESIDETTTIEEPNNFDEVKHSRVSPIGTIVDPICVCQRCFKLQQYGSVEETLRPGWSTNELLSPERFESLLGEIKKTKAVVLCLIDIFDLQGSILSNLKDIIGDNPIIVAANKIDLLPKDASQSRVKSWIIKEIKSVCNFRSPRDQVLERKERQLKIQSLAVPEYVKKVDESGVLAAENVFLVSCQSGYNVNNLLDRAMALAEKHGNKIYVMGAANVGKSSLINKLLSGVSSKQTKQKSRKSEVPKSTVSSLPGTTLDFLKISLPNGISVIDTPGLMNKGQLTAKLTLAELKRVVPSKPINAVTLRLSEGKAVLIGGLGQVELVEGRPFFFTFYISNDIKLHPTNSSKVDEFIQKHIGTLVFPPDNINRLNDLGPFENKYFEIEGESWKEGAADIVIAGLGWIMITGPGKAKIKVTVPKGTNVGTRQSLMPFEASYTTAKFTGGKIVKKSGKGDSSYGWRA